ncbi:MAG TPA: alpha/beta hydrolase [Trebonia sp.]|jgi:pimeloyl-ACP methyl ester carboxylesterase
MTDQVPIVLIPGLLCTSRLYAQQLPSLWQSGPVMVANHQHADSMAAIAGQILAAAPPRFALAGLSMGGYLAFEIMRQAPDRVSRLALLDTSARPDVPEKTRTRHEQVALARDGRLGEVVDTLYQGWAGPERRDDSALRQVVRQMAADTGPEAFARQQAAIMNRPDSRPGLGAIGCPVLVAVGADDQVTTPEHAQEIADGIRGSRLVVIPGSGHLSTLEQPDAVTKTLTEWRSWQAGA